jgi:hypothetical protein
VDLPLDELVSLQTFLEGALPDACKTRPTIEVAILLLAQERRRRTL